MPRRILVLLFGDIGDTLLTVPALRAIRQRYPDACITLIGKREPARIVSGLGLVDATIEADKHLFDRPWSVLFPSAWRELWRLWTRLRSVRADTTVLFHHLVTRWGTVKFMLLTLASGARCRVGLNNGRGWFLTRSVLDRGFGARHEAEYWMDVAGLLDASGPLALEAPTTEEDRQRVKALLGALGLSGHDLVAVHPGTGSYGPGRRWPAERFASTLQLVMDRAPVIGVIVGGADDSAQTDQVAQMLGNRAVNLSGQTSIGELGALLERCRVLIANDSGVGHIAATARTPVVSIFGPSNDAAWRPLTATVVKTDLPCRPCFYRGFERGLPAGCSTRECLYLVTPSQVADATLSILRQQHDVP